MHLPPVTYLQSACRAIESALNQGYSSVELKTDSAYTIKGSFIWSELCFIELTSLVIVS